MVAGSNDGSISETLSGSVGVKERGECAKGVHAYLGGLAGSGGKPVKAIEILKMERT